jgi:hypothetical protein
MPRQQTHAAPAEEPKHQDAPVPPAEPTAEPAQVSIVDEVLSLKRSWESKKEAAIQELLKKRTAIEKAFNENLKEIEDQLTELGYTREPDFVQVPASRVQPFRKAKAKSAREKFCPICTTDPEKPVLGHDGRKHKGQKRKRPFTEAELKALGR